MLRRSVPMSTLSLACSSSFIPIRFLPLLADNSAASFTRLSKSAPVKPGVPRDNTERFTSSASGLFLECTFSISSLPLISGIGTTTCRSKRPGRNIAGSKISGLFVAAIRMIPSLTSKPSISTRSWFRVCSRSSCPPPSPAPRYLPTASISSMKTIQGVLLLACKKRSLTREAPTPTNISTKSEPLMLKKGTSASPAMARARRVLPVPGGPTNKIPLGILPPSLVNFCGSFKNSIISVTSSFDSSMPATSLKVTFFPWSLRNTRARLLPKDMAFPPPTCICRIKKIHSPIITSMGSSVIRRELQIESLIGSAVIATPFARNILTKSGSSGA